MPDSNEQLVFQSGDQDLSEPCIGIGFVENIDIENNTITLKVGKGITAEIKTLVKGTRGLDLDAEQMHYLSGNTCYLDAYDRESIIQGSDYFIKTKRVFRNKPNNF